MASAVAMPMAGNAVVMVVASTVAMIMVVMAGAAVVVVVTSGTVAVVTDMLVAAGMASLYVVGAVLGGMDVSRRHGVAHEWQKNLAKPGATNVPPDENANGILGRARGDRRIVHSSRSLGVTHSGRSQDGVSRAALACPRHRLAPTPRRLISRGLPHAVNHVKTQPLTSARKIALGPRDIAKDAGDQRVEKPQQMALAWQRDAREREALEVVRP